MTPRDLAGAHWHLDHCRSALRAAARAEGVRLPEEGGRDPRIWMELALRAVLLAGRSEPVAAHLSGARCAALAAGLRELAPDWEGPIRIWHLSDLHFGPHHWRLTPPAGGAPYVFADSIIEAMAARGEERPDLLVISGDVTWQADVLWRCRKANDPSVGDDESEFGAAVDFLEKAKAALRPLRDMPASQRVLVLPGNHDVAWIGDADVFASFRCHLPADRVVTPYTVVPPKSREEPHLTVASTTDCDRTPCAVCRYVMRGLDLVLAMVVTTFWEGRLPSKRPAGLKAVYAQIEEAHRAIVHGDWSAITHDDLVAVLKLVEELANHTPVLTPRYRGTVLELLRKVLDSEPSSGNQLRLFVAHHPLGYVAGGGREMAVGSEAFVSTANQAFSGIGETPIFHGILSGHLHASHIPRPEQGAIRLLSAGTAGARLSLEAVPTQANAFAELTVSLEAGVRTATYTPVEWEDGAWVWRKDSAVELTGRGTR